MREVLLACICAVLISAAAGLGGYGRDESDDPEENCCELPREDGSCHENHKRFYFDKTTKRCNQFTFKGCKNNENNFKTEDECYNACKRHSNRMPDEETSFHSMTIKMANPFDFYMKHKEEYKTSFKAGVAKHLPISTTEIKIKNIQAGSTVIKIEITRSFTDNSIRSFVSKVQSGSFSFVVAGQSVNSVPNQKSDLREYEGKLHRYLRCRKIAMVVVPVIVFIAIIVGLIILIKCIKKKHVRAAPVENSKAVWNSSSPDTLSIEKKFPPVDFVTADEGNMGITPPNYESVTSPPPAYASMASIRPPPTPEAEAIPSKIAT